MKPSEVVVVRAFIAIELSESIHISLRQFQQQLQSTFVEMPIRWVPVNNIHLTLKFLGDIQSEKINPLNRTLEQITAEFPIFDYTICELGCFPSCKRPRVLWLGVEQVDGQLVQLQTRIEKALLYMGFQSERRPFHPHLTLARIKKSITRDQLKSLAHQLEDVEAYAGSTGSVEQIHLIQSKLLPYGAEYTHLGSANLGSKS